MSFEDDVNELNRQYFFREFTYSQTTFRPVPTTQLELADSFIWLDDSAIAFQIKERSIDGSTSPELEEEWFASKVVKLATKQVRDTLLYLDQHSPIDLVNRRGHKRSLHRSSIKTLHKVVCYEPAPELPDRCKNKRFHISSTAGVIHLMASADYIGVVRTLLTPAEVMDYFDFRERLIVARRDDVGTFPEQAILGQFLKDGNADIKPSLEHANLWRNIKHDSDRWDISGILEKFADRIIDQSPSEEYYPILVELAKLKRNELSEFKLRFMLTRENAVRSVPQSYRMYCHRTGCAFVFVSVPIELKDKKVNALQNFTIGGKYSLRAHKSVGVCICPDTDGYFLADWCFVEAPWEQEPLLDEWLKNSPFPEVREVELKRYDFE